MNATATNEAYKRPSQILSRQQRSDDGALMRYAQDGLPFGGAGPGGAKAYCAIEGAPFGRLAETLLTMMLR
jgi:hypothetical protein